MIKSLTNKISTSVENANLSSFPSQTTFARTRKEILTRLLANTSLPKCIVYGSSIRDLVFAHADTIPQSILTECKDDIMGDVDIRTHGVNELIREVWKILDELNQKATILYTTVRAVHLSTVRIMFYRNALIDITYHPEYVIEKLCSDGMRIQDSEKFYVGPLSLYLSDLALHLAYPHKLVPGTNIRQATTEKFVKSMNVMKRFIHAQVKFGGRKAPIVGEKNLLEMDPVNLWCGVPCVLLFSKLLNIDCKDLGNLVYDKNTQTVFYERAVDTLIPASFFDGRLSDEELPELEKLFPNGGFIYGGFLENPIINKQGGYVEYLSTHEGRKINELMITFPLFGYSWQTVSPQYVMVEVMMLWYIGVINGRTRDRIMEVCLMLCGVMLDEKNDGKLIEMGVKFVSRSADPRINVEMPIQYRKITQSTAQVIDLEYSGLPFRVFDKESEEREFVVDKEVFDKVLWSFGEAK